MSAYRVRHSYHSKLFLPILRKETSPTNKAAATVEFMSMCNPN